MNKYIFIPLVFFIFTLTSAFGISESEYRSFLRFAYCDILGVTRNETTPGEEKKWFDQHLRDLMNKEKSPDDIISHFTRARAWHDISPLGSSCGDGARKELLKNYQDFLDKAYCDNLGVKKNPMDEAYKTRFINLATGKSSYENTKQDLANWASCNQKNSSTFPISGEKCTKKASVSTGNCSLSGKSGSEGELPHENSDGDIKNNWSKLAVENGELVRYQRSYDSKDYRKLGLSFDKTAPGCEHAKYYELEAKYHKKFEDEIKSCQIKILSKDDTCFMEALLFKSDVIKNCPGANGSSEYAKTFYSCRNEYILKANSRLQQKGCKRRIDDCVHCSKNQDEYMVEFQLKDLLFGSRYWEINDDINKSRFYDDPWDHIDYEYLKCVNDSADQLHREYNFEQARYNSSEYKACGMNRNLFHSCWKDQGTGAEHCTMTSNNDTRFLNPTITEQLPVDVKKKALTRGEFRQYFYVHESKPLFLGGKKYWGFYFYYTLDSSAQLVKVDLWSGNYLKGNDWKIDADGFVEFGENGKPKIVTAPTDSTVQVAEMNAGLSPGSDSIEKVLTEVKVEKASLLREFEKEVEVVGCSSKVEALCDHQELVKLKIPERIKAKDNELYQRVIHQMKLNPASVHTDLAKKNVKINTLKLINLIELEK